MLVYMVEYLALGLNFKLDVGTFRFCLQVACQRYRQTSVIAKFTDRVVAFGQNLAAVFSAPRLQSAYALAA